MTNTPDTFLPGDVIDIFDLEQGACRIALATVPEWLKGIKAYFARGYLYNSATRKYGTIATLHSFPVATRVK